MPRAGTASWTRGDSGTLPSSRRFVAALRADVARPGALASYWRRSTGTPVETWPDGFVPQTWLWWVAGDEFLGRLSIRHRLTPHLLVEGGNIGYEVRPSARRTGARHGDARRRAAARRRRSASSSAHLDCDGDNVGLAARHREERRRAGARSAAATSTTWCRRDERRAPLRRPRRASSRPRAPRSPGPCGTCTSTCRSAARAATTATSPRPRSATRPTRRLLDAYVDGVAAEWKLRRQGCRLPPTRTSRALGGAAWHSAASTRSTSAAARPASSGRTGSSGCSSSSGRTSPRSAEVTVEVNPEDVDESASAAGPRPGVAAGGRRAACASRSACRASRRACEALGRRAEADPAGAFARLRAAGVAQPQRRPHPRHPRPDGGRPRGRTSPPSPRCARSTSPGTSSRGRGRRASRGAAGAAPALDPTAMRRPTRTMTSAPPATAASCARSPPPATTGTRSATSRCRAGGRATTWRTGAPARTSASARAP